MLTGRLGGLQVKQNVQRTLAIELQKLSVQFRKQQKAYLNKIRQQGSAGPSGNFWALDDDRSGQKGAEDYDPGFSDVQVQSQILIIHTGLLRVSVVPLLWHCRKMWLAVPVAASLGLPGSSRDGPFAHDSFAQCLPVKGLVTVKRVVWNNPVANFWTAISLSQVI